MTLTTLPAITELHDLKGPVDFPTSYLLLWLILGLTALFLIGLFVYSRFLKPGVAPEKPKVIKKPWDVALEALETLTKENLLARQLFDQFYFRLSNIVRKYIEDRFGVRAPEMTTEEFLHSLGIFSGLTTKQKEILQDFLTSCDMVKFAKFTPTVEEAERSWQFARDLVQETILRDVSSV